jgi:hypothetical protein
LSLSQDTNYPEVVCRLLSLWANAMIVSRFGHDCSCQILPNSSVILSSDAVHSESEKCGQILGMNSTYKTRKQVRINMGQQTLSFHVGFEVFTAMVMKSIIFWDMTQWTTRCHISEDGTLHFLSKLQPSKFYDHFN